MGRSRNAGWDRSWGVVILWALFAFSFHSAGNVNGMYERYWWFQVIAHYWSASALAALFARAGLSLGYRGWRLVAFVVGFSAVGALGWELVEYLKLFENLHFHGFDDSAIDLVADSVGVTTVLAYLWHKTRFGRVDHPAYSTRTGPESAE